MLLYDLVLQTNINLSLQINYNRRKIKIKGTIDTGPINHQRTCPDIANAHH